MFQSTLQLLFSKCENLLACKGHANAMCSKAWSDFESCYASQRLLSSVWLPFSATESRISTCRPFKVGIVFTSKHLPTTGRLSRVWHDCHLIRSYHSFLPFNLKVFLSIWIKIWTKLDDLQWDGVKSYDYIVQDNLFRANFYFYRSI